MSGTGRAAAAAGVGATRGAGTCVGGWAGLRLGTALLARDGDAAAGATAAGTGDAAGAGVGGAIVAAAEGAIDVGSGADAGASGVVSTHRIGTASGGRSGRVPSSEAIQAVAAASTAACTATDTSQSRAAIGAGAMRPGPSAIVLTVAAPRG